MHRYDTGNATFRRAVLRKFTRAEEADRTPQYIASQFGLSLRDARRILKEEGYA
ncbi:hypothetical protein [Nannocystis pusilla]|uniref:hypothetical protein n=1 Tax=Nannocystis pusilla TaxID=889268 RepID=UPI003B7DA80B